MSKNIANVIVIHLTGNLASEIDEATISHHVDEDNLENQHCLKEEEENLEILNKLSAATAAVIVDDDFQCHLDKDQARIDAKNQCFLEEELALQAMGEMHSHEERLAAAADDWQQQENLVRQEELRMVAEQEEHDRIEAQCRAILRAVANKMRALSMTRFLPPQTQLECVTKDHRTYAEALTFGGDHRTPCASCSHRNAHCKDCFWVLKTFDFSLKGREFQANQHKRNNEVCHYLYRQFIIEEYSYMQDGILICKMAMMMNFSGLLDFPVCRSLSAWSGTSRTYSPTKMGDLLSGSGDVVLTVVATGTVRTPKLR